MARLIACSACGKVHMNNYMCKIKKKRDREKKENRIDSIKIDMMWYRYRYCVMSISLSTVNYYYI